jgi:hypothetical protein
LQLRDADSLNGAAVDRIVQAWVAKKYLGNKKIAEDEIVQAWAQKICRGTMLANLACRCKVVKNNIVFWIRVFHL